MITSPTSKIKPEFREPLPDNIPKELKSIPQWIVWRAIWEENQDGGRWIKLSIDAKTGGIASIEDPETWADFETAYKAHQAGGCDGIGIVLTENLSLCGFDFDNCVKNGEIAPEVNKLLDQLNTYAEYTPTDGIRALAFGRKPEMHKLPPNGYEVYDSARFLAITGHPANGCARIEERQPEIESVCQVIFRENQQDQSTAKEEQARLSNSQDADLLEHNKVEIYETLSDKLKKKAIVDEMNKEYAVVVVGGKCRVMKEVFDPASKQHDIILMGTADFHVLFSNKLFFPKGKKKEITHSKLWISSKDRREFIRIVFEPPSKGKAVQVPATYYNLWRGFGVEPRKGEWDLFKDHIYVNICNEDEFHFRWLMTWLARIVQDPGGERPGVAVVLLGKRGTGKSVFVNIFGRILGQHFLQVSNPKHFTGNFNMHLKDRLVVACDEGFWGKRGTDEGVLKSLITEPTINIEGKGQDVITIKNHMYIIITTNNEWVIPAGLEERRFFAMDVSDRHMQDHPYFQAICAQMESGGVEAMLHDLLEWDDPDVNLREAPKTQALLSQIECSMSPIQKWWYQRLSDGEIPEGTDHWHSLMPTAEVYDDYLTFVSKLKLSNAHLTNKQFGKQLRKIAPSLTRVNRSGVMRKWKYGFSELDVHRREFEEIMGYKLDWDPED